jgi:serine/threonine protein kinase/formylglycine-generating enzyme required for sulfatase activity
MNCPKCQAEILDDSQFCSKCGTPIHPGDKAFLSHTHTILRPIDELVPGALLVGKYKIIDVAGRGGMGIVYKAEDIKLKRKVALKFMPPELTKDNEARERFVLEAQAAAALSHPNICTIHEIDEELGKSFIAMEYVDGFSLNDRIDKGPIEVEKAVDIAVQIAAGLEQAHQKGIVHRDVKSANIMVTDKGQVKIMDFGLAKVKEGTLLTRAGTTLGTVAYMSPEQARGEEVDQRTDVWSLGIVLYEMLTGQLPFVGDREASILYSVVHEEAKPVRAWNSDLPLDLQHIVNRALKKKLAARYQSVSEMLKELRQFETTLKTPEVGITDLRSFLRFIRKPYIAWPAILVLIAVCLFTVWFFTRNAKVRWAKEQAIPELLKLSNKGDFAAAFHLAQQAERYIPEDPRLTEIWPEISRQTTVETDPPGADVFIKNYDAADSDWEHLGQSPIENIRICRELTQRWKITKDGYETAEQAAFAANQKITFELNRIGDIPSGMIRVPGGERFMRMAMLGYLEPVQLGDFLIDKYEVTNKQFKEFVDNGGYRNQDYWRYGFIKDGKNLSWEEAVAEFQDMTGRPGPSTWKLGTYHEGQENYPVNGISWYEAAAYAVFAGKSLPTIYHWAAVAGIDYGADIIPLSNFSKKGLTPVGTYQGMSPNGTFDMGGNVKEWCWNESGGMRYILGGCWDDPTYMFSLPFAQSAFDRSASNGFRCIKELSSELTSKLVYESIPLPPPRDFSKAKPVSDEIFPIYKSLYSYDKSELNPVSEYRDESPKYWIKEKITFDAAYGNERMIAYLFLPKNSSPPYQTVIYFPGSDFEFRSSEEIIPRCDFIVKSGRALLYPIYKSTYERHDGFSLSPPHFTANAYRDHCILWSKDVGRSIDFLESRTDVNINKLAYVGSSLGSVVGSILLALEGRLKVSVLVIGGFVSGRMPPEADQINFLPRIRIPTLMLNGKYDYLFPLETTQIPMFQFLGTPDEHKLHLTYDSEHWIPQNEEIKEILNWLDKYLGPVK